MLISNLKSTLLHVILNNRVTQISKAGVLGELPPSLWAATHPAMSPLIIALTVRV
jgi:hypothetical protein